MAKPLKLSKERLIDKGWRVHHRENGWKLESPQGEFICVAESEEKAWRIAEAIVDVYNASNEQLLTELEASRLTLEREKADAMRAYQKDLMEFTQDHTRRIYDALKEIADDI